MVQYVAGVRTDPLLRSRSNRTVGSESSGSFQDVHVKNDEVTVGYEMEMLVAILNEPKDPHPDDTRWCIPFVEHSSRSQLPESALAKKSIIEVIREAGLPAMLNSSKAANPEGLPSGLLVSRYYRVVYDSSLHADQWDIEQDCYDWVGAELVSRVLHYPEESDREVRRICGDLRDKMRLHLNRTTGFHVHIGVSDLSLTQLKKFLTLYWAVEDVLFSLCAPHRRDSVYCEPVRESADAVFGPRCPSDMIEPSKMTALFPDIVPEDIRHELIPIWKAKERHDLVYQLLKPPAMDVISDRAALALRAHGPFNIGTDDFDVCTFEFRHLQGTVNPNLIKNWTDVVVALLQGARRHRNDFKMLLQDLLQSATLPPTQACNSMLTDLSLEAAISFWAQQREINSVEAGRRTEGLALETLSYHPLTQMTLMAMTVATTGMSLNSYNKRRIYSRVGSLN